VPTQDERKPKKKIAHRRGGDGSQANALVIRLIASRCSAGQKCLAQFPSDKEKQLGRRYPLTVNSPLGADRLGDGRKEMLADRGDWVGKEWDLYRG